MPRPLGLGSNACACVRKDLGSQIDDFKTNKDHLMLGPIMAQISPWNLNFNMHYSKIQLRQRNHRVWKNQNRIGKGFPNTF